MGVGDKIKMHRKILGLTQTELGEKVGVKKNAVSKWECGRVEDIPTSTIKELANIFGVPASYLIDDTSSDEPPHHALRPIPRMKEWKVIGAVSCGTGIYKESCESVMAPADIDADYVFGCVGDSMIGAHIFDGDIVFIKMGETVPDGTIGLVRMEEEYMLKRIFHGRDYIELRSENPKYPPRILRGDQLNAEIVGRAVKVLTNVV